jgi:hypothetical protein
MGAQVRQCGLRLPAQARKRVVVLESEATQPEVTGPQVQPSGACALVVGGGHVAFLELIGWELHVYVRVLCEAARRRRQQASVLGHLHEQGLDGLQSEGDRGTDQLDVVVAGINQRVLGQRVTHGGGNESRAAG